MAKESTNKNEPAKEIFFFSGSTEYEPISIEAVSREEAEKEWIKVRKPTAQPASTGDIALQDKKVVE